MTQETLNKVLKKTDSEFKTAIKFIKGMIAKKIPVSAIGVNDWSSSTATMVSLTIPYGSAKNGGKSKSWKNRFGDTALKSAIKFWNTRK